MVKKNNDITKPKMILALIGAFVVGLPVYIFIYPIMHPDNPKFNFTTTANPASVLLGIVAAYLVEDRPLYLKIVSFIVGLGISLAYSWAFGFTSLGRIGLVYSVVFFAKMKFFKG